jgi:serine/threonine protein kinase
MNEFRQSLDRLLEGKASLDAVDKDLQDILSKQPNLAAAHGAIIEAMYRSNRISGETYLALIRTIHSFQQTLTQSRALARAQASEGDKTVIRIATRSADVMPGPVIPTLAPAAPPPPAEQDEGDKTIIRTPPPVQVTTQPPLQSLTTPTATTGSSWSDPGRWSTVDSTPLGPGSVIKERFVLEEQIGRGGMGTVFKARDLRKEEAQDRNPYVAIKILNEEFKRHPQSLQALQREARKAQKLAHPNIVTVYDFDRDAANVYMVMELLEGESLDRVIKRSEGVGVGSKEALRITRDLCKAMSYAHEQGIVHADFKPANAFRTKDGVVKVFDFGIARAVKRGDQDSGTTTLFDPGTLGALTPAYASTEVIDGADPDARDDVYAIACVVYELLTGRHPFNRMSAAQARASNVVLTPPPELSRRQWRALQRSLESPREQRPASATRFLDELLPLRNSPTVYVGAAAAAVAVVVLGIMIITNQVAKYRERSLADMLASADVAQVEEVLPKLRTLTPAERATVFANNPARTGLIRYFEGRINDAVDVAKAHYAYPKAEALLAEAKRFFPDSQAVRDIEERLLARKSDEIKQQSDLLDTSLENGTMIDAQGRPNVMSVLAVLRQVDPQSGLLHDPRLPGAFASRAKRALEGGDPVLAGALVDSGLSFDADDPMLTDLRDQVRLAASAQKFAARKGQLEESLRRLITPSTTLEDVVRQRAPLAELRNIDSKSPVLVAVQSTAQRAMDQRMAALMAKGEPDQARELLARYTDVVSASYVDAKRQSFSSDSVTEGTPAADGDTANTVGALANADMVPNLSDEELRRQLNVGLEQPRISLADARSLSTIADELIRRGDTEAEEGKKKLKIHMANDAKAIRARRGVDAALQYAEGAYALFPESQVLRKALVDLRVAANERAAEQRDASVVEVKTKIDALLASKRIDGEWATAIDRQFRRLAAFLPDNDPYVVQAKFRAAVLYAGRAGLLREARRLTEAESALQRARGYAANVPEVAAEDRLLKETREKQEQYNRERDRAAALTSLKQKLLVQAQANDVVEAQLSLTGLTASLPPDDHFVTTEGPEAIAQAYVRMASNAAKEGRFKNAVSLAERGREIAPSLKEIGTIRQRYARYQVIDDHLMRRPRIEARSIRAELTALAKQDPTEAAVVNQRLVRNLVARIQGTQDAELASRLARAAIEIFGEDSVATISANTTPAASSDAAPGPARY